MIILEYDIETIKKRIKDKRNSNFLEKREKEQSNYFRNLLSRVLITIILVLLSIIYINRDNQNLLNYKEQVLTKSFSFAPFKKWYQNYFGDIIPVDVPKNNEAIVSKESLDYKDITPFLDGNKISFDGNTIINNITSGIVVYMGEKENYGNVLIIPGIDGVDIWYGNITNTSIQLYDYVEKNTYLGQTKDNSLYLVYSKDGNFLNYKEYLQ